MPFYEYEHLQTPQAPCQARFTVLQKMQDAHLDVCPTCGNPCRRLISAPNVQSPNSHRLSDAHAEKHGFTQYRKVEKGVYEKAYGQGPKVISDPGD